MIILNDIEVMVGKVRDERRRMDLPVWKRTTLFLEGSFMVQEIDMYGKKYTSIGPIELDSGLTVNATYDEVMQALRTATEPSNNWVEEGE